MKRAMGWVAVVGVCAFFAGCKSGDDDAAPISQDEFPGAMASLFCDSLGDCCAQAKLVFDSTNCRAATSAQVKASLNETRTAAIIYDAEAAGECIAGLKTRTKCGRTDIDAVPACDRILTGTLAVGERCMNSAECAAPGYCRTEGVTLEGICAASSAGSAAPRGKAGDTCAGSCAAESSCVIFAGDPIDPGVALVACYRDDSLYCNGVCEPLKAIGETCDAATACKDGLFCDFDSRICTAPHPDGASCSSDVECQSGNCDSDAASVSGGGTCLGASVTAETCANGRL